MIFRDMKRSGVLPVFGTNSGCYGFLLYATQHLLEINHLQASPIAACIKKGRHNEYQIETGQRPRKKKKSKGGETFKQKENLISAEYATNATRRPFFIKKEK